MPRTLIQRPYPSFRHGLVLERHQPLASLGLVPKVSRRPYGAVDFNNAPWITFGAASAGVPLTRAPTNANKITAVSWFKVRTLDTHPLWDSESAVGTFVTGAGADMQLRCILRLINTTTVLMQADTPLTSIVTNTWYCSMMSVNLANTAERNWYLNGAPQTVTWGTYTDGSIYFTKDQWAQGAFFSGGLSVMDGLIAVNWIMPGVYMDFALEGNLRKFITPAGRPADLGEHGEAPTGQLPLLYHCIRKGEDPSRFALNRAATETFKVNGGALKATTDAP